VDEGGEPSNVVLQLPLVVAGLVGGDIAVGEHLGLDRQSGQRRAQFLSSSDPTIQEVAVAAMGRTMSPAAAPYLIEALGDDSGGVRSAAETWLLTIASALEKQKQFTERFEKIKK